MFKTFAARGLVAAALIWPLAAEPASPPPVEAPHGVVVSSQRLASEIGARDSQGRRQRGRRGRRGRLRRGGRQPLLRQHRRRRIHADPPRQGQSRRLHQLPRDRPRGGDKDHVPRRRGSADFWGEPQRLPRRRDARQRARPRHRAPGIRNPAARKNYGAGDRAGSRRFCPHPRRRRHFRLRRVALQASIP